MYDPNLPLSEYKTQSLLAISHVLASLPIAIGFFIYIQYMEDIKRKYKNNNTETKSTQSTGNPSEAWSN